MTERRPETDRSELVGKGEWTHEAVRPGCECPGCKERCMDLLVWVEDDRVGCHACGTTYDPRGGTVHAYCNSNGGIEDASDA